jgi:amino acid permease
MTCSYLFAVTVSDLSTVLGLVGATGSTTICYILPGMFYYKLCEVQRPPASKMSLMQRLSILMVGMGFFIMITSLINIMFGGNGH